MNDLKSNETIESLSIKLKASNTNNKRLRFELEQENRRHYSYKEKIEFLEKQLQTTNNILQSVSALLEMKVSKMRKEDKNEQQ